MTLNLVFPGRILEDEIDDEDYDDDDDGEEYFGGAPFETQMFSALRISGIIMLLFTLLTGYTLTILAKVRRKRLDEENSSSIGCEAPSSLSSSHHKNDNEAEIDDVLNTSIMFDSAINDDVEKAALWNDGSQSPERGKSGHFDMTTPPLTPETRDSSQSIPPDAPDGVDAFYTAQREIDSESDPSVMIYPSDSETTESKGQSSSLASVPSMWQDFGINFFRGAGHKRRKHRVVIMADRSILREISHHQEKANHSRTHHSSQMGSVDTLAPRSDRQRSDSSRARRTVSRRTIPLGHEQSSLSTSFGTDEAMDVSPSAWVEFTNFFSR